MRETYQNICAETVFNEKREYENTQCPCVRDIKMIMSSNMGETIYYGDFSFQVYSDGIKAALFYKGVAILRMDIRDTNRDEKNRLYFATQRKKDETLISYADIRYLTNQEPITNLFKVFPDRKGIKNAVAGLLLLPEYA